MKTGFNERKLNGIRDMFKRYTDSGQIAGISAAIMRKDQVVFRENLGYADLEKGTEIADDTIYRIYSMTKPITVTAALILFERGLFTLDDPLSKYIPSFARMKVLVSYEDGNLETKPAETTITVRHLMTMTSGMSYGFTEDPIDRYYNEYFEKHDEGDVTLEEFTDILAKLPLAFEPGTSHRYSFSIDVLGRLVEIWSGKKLSVFFEEEIFKPLKMVDTGFYVPADKLDRLSEFYEYKDGRLVKNSIEEPGEFRKEPVFEMAGGGLVSTVDDYLKFCQMLLRKGKGDGFSILGEKSIDLMSSNHLFGDVLDKADFTISPGYGYGLGVRVMMDPAKAGLNVSAGEWGWSGMAGTWMCIDPGEELIALYMVQLAPGEGDPVFRYYQQMMYGAIEESYC